MNAPCHWSAIRMKKPPCSRPREKNIPSGRCHRFQQPLSFACCLSKSGLMFRRACTNHLRSDGHHQLRSWNKEAIVFATRGSSPRWIVVLIWTRDDFIRLAANQNDLLYLALITLRIAAEQRSVFLVRANTLSNKIESGGLDFKFRLQAESNLVRT